MKKLIVISFFVTCILLFGSLYLYCFFGVKKVNLNFSKEILNELKNDVDNTSKGYELFGYLYVENNSVVDYDLVGYKFLQYSGVTGNSILLEKDVIDSDISIHSHPSSGLMACWISPIDKIKTPVSEKIICIYCKGEVKCYENN